MKINLGYVAMSMNLRECSPSKTVTLTTLDKLDGNKAKITRLKKIARENIENTLRILKYNKSMGINVYRLSSKIFPLATYPGLEFTNYIDDLASKLKELGDYIKINNMRVSSHPDHFVLLNSISSKVYENSVADLNYHLKMFEAMGLDENYKFVLHVGGIYSDKGESIKRFYEGFEKLSDDLKKRIILENDDKTFNAIDTLQICKNIGVPMVLDLHHNRCNRSEVGTAELINRAFLTWEKEKLKPKVHFSSSKDLKRICSHADFIDKEEFIDFLNKAKKVGADFDVMIEAKGKDNALLKLYGDITKEKEKFQNKTIDI